jgi:hypothetical protein
MFLLDSQSGQLSSRKIIGLSLLLLPMFICGLDVDIEVGQWVCNAEPYC